MDINGQTAICPGCEYANESGFTRMSFPRSQVNPSVESGLSRGVGIPLRTAVVATLHARTDPFAYIPAHQRDRHIDESNSDSHGKDFYDRRRDAENSRERGNE